MLRGTPRERVGALARQALATHARAGAPIVRRGERVPGLMVVIEGLAKLALKGESERVLRFVGPGETFGEAALLLGEPLPIDAVAVTDTALIVVPAAPLLALFDRDRRFARELLATLCRRLQAMVADFESVTLHDAGERLAAYLGSLGAETVCLPAPKAMIASRLGMTKETLSRLLRTFMDQGLISVAKREITLLDRARLSALARGEHPAEA
jgi:CRP/FNR family transcriptional regulator, dissimilatory nitrate respiration regulator